MNRTDETRSLDLIAAPKCAGAVRFGRSRRDQADGFTLIELMVSIAIIAIIAAFSVGVIFTAQDQARASATEALISKLHAQMAMRWEEYGTRRVGVQPLPAGSSSSVQLVNSKRVFALQELMRFELPDQYIDIVNPSNTQNALPTPQALGSIPSLTYSYRRRIARARGLSNGASASDWVKAVYGPTAQGEPPPIAAEHQSAECLYLIMTTGMIDASSSGDYFNDSESGDTDGDGMREFIDGWGRPIEWIRWPTAFVSDMQPGTVYEDSQNGQQLVDRDVAANRDPFNPIVVDDRMWLPPYTGRGNLPDLSFADIKSGKHEWGYRLTPLIMSLGRDGREGIVFHWYGGQGVPQNDRASDPYAVFANGEQRGQIIPGQADGSYEDNIHNQLVGTR